MELGLLFIFFELLPKTTLKVIRLEADSLFK
jgi:hypothetical protein